MGLWNELFNRGSYQVDTSSAPSWVEVMDDGSVFYEYISSVNGRMGGRTVFNGRLPMSFATTIAEVFVPIDAIADRVASCHFELYSTETDQPVKRVPKRLQELLAKPNYLQDMSGLVYDMIFSELAAGGSYTLTKQASFFKYKSYENITNLWVLNPDSTEPKILRSIADPFIVKNISELVESYRTHFIRDMVLQPDEITVNIITKIGDDLRPITPLHKVEKNINNLLAVYSARYNVFVNNGSAKIIAAAKGTGDFQESILPANRQMLIDDMNNRDGIVGRGKNFVGILGKPIEVHETLGKIKDLEPFKETIADLVTIGGIYGVGADLLPTGESSTFANQRDAERHFWSNTIVPYARGAARVLTTALWLPPQYEIRATTDHIELLQDDRKVTAEVDSIELENIKKLDEMGVDTTKRKEKWIIKD